MKKYFDYKYLVKNLYVTEKKRLARENRYIIFIKYNFISELYHTLLQFFRSIFSNSRCVLLIRPASRYTVSFRAIIKTFLHAKYFARIRFHSLHSASHHPAVP